MPGRVFGVSLEDTLRQEHYADALGLGRQSLLRATSAFNSASSDFIVLETEQTLSSSTRGSSNSKPAAVNFGTSLTASLTQSVAPAPASLRTAPATPELVYFLIKVCLL